MMTKITDIQVNYVAKSTVHPQEKIYCNYLRAIFSQEVWSWYKVKLCRKLYCTFSWSAEFYCSGKMQKCAGLFSSFKLFRRETFEIS